jgi:RNA polymerase sigma-70 factor (ECF subfamily)
MAVERNAQTAVMDGAHRPMYLELTSTYEAVERETQGGLHMDESGFRAFYEQTSAPLLRFLVCITRRPDLAEDILQETYCRLLTIRLPPMDARQMRNYLFRIAGNLVRDRWRCSKNELPPENAVEIAAPLSHPDRNLIVRQAFDRLKPRERQLLWLAYVEGSSHQEIAESTGLRSGSIRLLLFRARRRMANLIARSMLPARRCLSETEFLH